LNDIEIADKVSKSSLQVRELIPLLCKHARRSLGVGGEGLGEVDIVVIAGPRAHSPPL